MERRNFLTTAGKGAIAVSLLGGLPATAATTIDDKSIGDVISVKLPPLEQPTEKEQAVSSISLPKGKRIGYAIVGLGNLTLGQILPGFGASKYGKPVALVSGDAEKAKKIAAQYGIDPKNIYNYQTFDQIKNNPEIDAVYILLPNALHEEYVVRAAKAGKHVLCEKPMATSAKACQNMIDACKKANKKLMIAYRIQYEPHNRLAMQWARDQKYG